MWLTHERWPAGLGLLDPRWRAAQFAVANVLGHAKRGNQLALRFVDDVLQGVHHAAATLTNRVFTVLSQVIESGADHTAGIGDVIRHMEYLPGVQRIGHMR